MCSEHKTAGTPFPHRRRNDREVSVPMSPKEPSSFRLSVADRVIEIRHLHPYLPSYCRDYLTDAAPDITVSVCRADIDHERERAAREAEVEGIPLQPYTDAYLETLAVYRKLAVELLAYDTLLLHGSCLSVDGQGYLFTAPSGTGKSTHTRLWRQTFGERCVMVNDDKPLLRITEGGVIAYGTPWDGKHRLSTPIGVPLRGICFLSRSVTNHIIPVQPMTKYPTLLQQTYRPEDATHMVRTMDLLARLTERVDFYALGCNMEPEAAEVAYRGMCPTQKG